MSDDEIINNAIAIFVDTEGMDVEDVEAIENALVWAVDQISARTKMLVDTMTPAYGTWVQRNSPNVRRDLVLELFRARGQADCSNEAVADEILDRFNVSPKAS